jgi:hypothetical protein
MARVARFVDASTAPKAHAATGVLSSSSRGSSPSLQEKVRKKKYTKQTRVWIERGLVFRPPLCALKIPAAAHPTTAKDVRGRC